MDRDSFDKHKASGWAGFIRTHVPQRTSVETKHWAREALHLAVRRAVPSMLRLAEEHDLPSWRARLQERLPNPADITDVTWTRLQEEHGADITTVSLWLYPELNEADIVANERRIRKLPSCSCSMDAGWDWGYVERRDGVLTLHRFCKSCARRSREPCKHELMTDTERRETYLWWNDAGRWTCTEKQPRLNEPTEAKPSVGIGATTTTLESLKKDIFKSLVAAVQWKSKRQWAELYNAFYGKLCARKGLALAELYDGERRAIDEITERGLIDELIDIAYTEFTRTDNKQERGMDYV